MNVFISWSGERSREVAEALRGWLPKVVQAIDPFLSFEDIEKGTHWRGEISENLEKASAGIVCLTKDNLTAPWLLFEAGAISKSVADASTYVCTYLLDLTPADVKEPLAQFQATVAEKDDTLKLLKTINGALGTLDEKQLEEIFDVWWPHLEEELAAIPDSTDEPEPERSDSDKIDEMLNLVRGLSRERDRISLQDAKEEIPQTTLGRVLDEMSSRIRVTENVLHSLASSPTPTSLFETEDSVTKEKKARKTPKKRTK